MVFIATYYMFIIFQTRVQCIYLVLDCSSCALNCVPIVLLNLSSIGMFVQLDLNECLNVYYFCWLWGFLQWMNKNVLWHISYILLFLVSPATISNNCMYSNQIENKCFKISFLISMGIMFGNLSFILDT